MERGSKKFKHLTKSMRLQLEGFLNAKLKIKDIAKLLNVHISTIYREVKRGEFYKKVSYTNAYNYGEKVYKHIKSYSSDIAQEKADINSHNHGIQLKIGNDFEFANYIENKIVNEHYTPLSVLGEIKRLNLKFKTSICVQTLYNYIKQGVFLKLSIKHLPIGITKKHNRKVVIKHIPTGKSIEERPDSINQRLEFGHWEMDCIESCKGIKTTLLCFTERLARQEIIFKMPNKTSSSVIKCLNSLEKRYGKLFSRVFKSITVDNGVEFLNTQKLENSLFSNKKRTTIYYCHPYSSFERGTNERLNREIRRIYPKGTNFSKVNINDIKKVENWINNYPRKIFNFENSNNIFNSYMQSIN